MIRTIAIAATAALLLAAPARAESIRIPTAGKSVEQVKLEVKKAAQYLCAHETRGALFFMGEYKACVDDAVYDALTQSRDPALMLAAK